MTITAGDRRHVEVVKDVIGPIVVIVIAMVIGAAASVFITVQLTQEQLSQVNSTLSSQSRINQEMISAIRALELSNARQQERNATEAVLLEKLQTSFENRYTDIDAVRELSPLLFRVTALETAVSDIRMRLNTLNREPSRGLTNAQHN